MTALGALLTLQQIWFDGKITSPRFLQIQHFQGWRRADLSGMGPFPESGESEVCI